MLSHVLVGTLTSGIMMVALLLLIVTALSQTPHTLLAQTDVIPWLFDLSDDAQSNLNSPEGTVLILSGAGDVVYSNDETACQVGQMLSDCAPQLAGLEAGSYEFDNRVRVVNDMVTGHRVISERETVNLLSVLPTVIMPAIVLALLSAPLALFLAWLTSGKLTQRLAHIASVAQRISAGELQARVQDPVTSADDIGQLAQQFNSMADVLEHSVSDLRDLAKENARLVQQAEQTAIRAERLRLSRDLHDSISQRLFSLSMSLSVLPGLIRENPQQSIDHSQRCADLAEDTLLDLRTLLVDLRPSSVIQKGLADAVQALCEDWSAINEIPVTCSMMLTGRYIPSALENVIYRVIQEGLSNVARHADATEVTVSLLESNQQLRLSVTDNGSGFDVNTDPKPGHFGLQGIRERVRSVGGTLHIESETGTTLQIRLPLQRDAIHKQEGQVTHD